MNETTGLDASMMDDVEANEAMDQANYAWWRSELFTRLCRATNRLQAAGRSDEAWNVWVAWCKWAD